MKKSLLVASTVLILGGCNESTQTNTTSNQAVQDIQSQKQAAILVSSEAELKTAIKNAQAGDNIVLKNGTYSDINIEFYGEGTAKMYLGIVNSIRPPALGGKPELANKYFEEAISISNGKNLAVKVEYANSYARTLYERELHDQLLNEVLLAETDAPGFTMSNTMAKEEAKRLLASADDYF